MPTQKKLRQKATKIVRKAFRECGFNISIPQAATLAKDAIKSSLLLTGSIEKVFPGNVIKRGEESFSILSEKRCGDGCCIEHGIFLKEKNGAVFELLNVNRMFL